MSLELYINEHHIELSDQSNIGLTFQANTLSNLESRQGVFSNEFKVPKTRLNQIALENAFNINSSTLLPYRKNGAKVVQEGIEVVPEGVSIITAFDLFYKIAVVSGNVDFFDGIKGRKLSDLDLSDLDHTYSFANVVASFTNTDGYIYAGVGFRKYTSNLTASNEGRCAFTFIHTLMERIASSIGYSIDGSFVDDFYYKNTILSTVFKHDDAWQLDKSVSSTYLSDVSQTDIYGGGGPLDVIYPFAFPDDGHFVSQLYTVPETGTYKFDCTFPIEFSSAFFTFFAVQIVNVTTATVMATEDIDPSTFTTGPVRGHTFSISTGFTSFSAGDQVQVRAAATLPGIGIYHWKYIAGAQFTATALNAFIPYNSGDVNMSYVQPDITQTDLYLAVMKMFCIIPQTNAFTKKIHLNKLNRIKDNLINALNWSDKIDVNRGVSVQYKDPSFAQKNWLRYSNDDDVKQGIVDFSLYETDSFFTIDDATLNEKADVVTLPFSGTIRQRIPYKNDDYTIDSFTPRVLVLAAREIDPTSTVALFTDVSYERGISFNKYSDNDALIDNYTLINEIYTRYKKITAFFNLNAIDIQNLDFTIPIYLDVHEPDIEINGHFYLNKVENYMGGKLTKCELIRL